MATTDSGESALEIERINVIGFDEEPDHILWESSKYDVFRKFSFVARSVFAVFEDSRSNNLDRVRLFMVSN
jgi:hypothetical protein